MQTYLTPQCEKSYIFEKKIITEDLIQIRTLSHNL